MAPQVEPQRIIGPADPAAVALDQLEYLISIHASQAKITPAEHDRYIRALRVLMEPFEFERKRKRKEPEAEMPFPG
jgi:hypothetical protein